MNTQKGKEVSAQDAADQMLMFWRLHVRYKFPQFQESAYFVPPVLMRRVKYSEVQLKGQTFNTIEPPAVNHDLEDESIQHITHFLRVLLDPQTEKEPVFVICQLDFEDFLKHTNYYKASLRQIPRPIDLKSQGKHKGDFDLLFLSKHYGLVAGEVKAVGSNLSVKNDEGQDTDVVFQVQKAVTQLDKAYDVLIQVISDLECPPMVRKALMLPNVTRSQLRRALDKDPKVRQNLCKCLGAKDPDYSDLCLTADELSCRDRPSDNILNVTAIRRWWTRVVAAPMVSLTDDAYEVLVSRFVGPATRVDLKVLAYKRSPLLSRFRGDVRSVGDGVAETSNRFTADIVLNRQQLDILRREDPLVRLCGPPGTGKTVTLVVMARIWLSRGCHVHVISAFKNSLAASYLIAHQLKETDRDPQQHSATDQYEQRVHHHVFDFSDGQPKSAVDRLVELADASEGPTCVVADEASDVFSINNGFTEFCEELIKHVPNLRLWAASLYHDNIPRGLTDFPMTVPLRTPPVVTAQVQKTDLIRSDERVFDYDTTVDPHRGTNQSAEQGTSERGEDSAKETIHGAVPPTDGPPVIVLVHKGPNHTMDDEGPINCEACGKDIAEQLASLHVSKPGRLETPTKTELIKAPLDYKDVILLTSTVDISFNDDENRGGLLRGLRDAGVPVKVVKPDDAEAIKNVALMAGPDHVVATSASCVCGLERAVVVWVKTDKTTCSDMLGRQVVSNWPTDEVVGRLHAISRTTAQLIVIVWPSSDHSNHADCCYA